MRGDGTIFKRGQVYWYKYFKHGKEERESLRTDKEPEARRRAKKIRDGLIDGTLAPASERRITVDELLDDLVLDLKAKKLGSLRTSIVHINQLRPVFGHLLAARLDTAAIQRYQTERQGSGVAPATLNRRLEFLRRAFRLAFDRSPQKIRRLPHVPLLPVNNARQGFTSAAEFRAILNGIDDADLRDFLEWFWWTAMRPGETSKLTWAMYDAETLTINLAPKAAKIGRGRLIPLYGPLREIIERRLERRRDDCQRIFYREIQGEILPVTEYRKSWAAACAAAGLVAGRNKEGGLTPYDLRRSALRNIVRAGADVTTAMRISGHLTRSTFDRYNIVDDEDVRSALEATVNYVSRLPGGEWAKQKKR